MAHADVRPARATVDTARSPDAQAASGSAQPGVLGPFKKKCIILAVLETDGRTQATAALGRVVIDLAEFAAIEQQETRMFQVSCNKSIHSAVGDPQLTVSVRCVRGGYIAAAAARHSYSHAQALRQACAML